MHAENHVGGRFRNCLVQAFDLKIDEAIRVLSGIFNALANGRIAQQRQRNFVELNVAAARRRERSDFLTKDAGEVGEKALNIAVGRGVGKIRAAVKVHRRRRRQRDLRRNLGHIANEAELIEGERPDAAQLAGGIGRGEIHHMAVIVAEFKFRGLDDKTLDALGEAPPIRAAAKLSIGDDLQARRLLQRDDIADATVLDLCEILIVDALGVMVLEGLAQLGRPKEAADMIGAKRGPAIRAREH